MTARGYTFPNLFVILAGRPGIGKSEAINRARSLIQATKVDNVYLPACNLAPTDVTKSSLYDYLASAKVGKLGPAPEEAALGIEGDHHYHSAFLAISELSDFVKDYDSVLLSALHGLYDCLPIIEEERRYRKDTPIKIPRAQVSLLGGTTPAFVSRTFPTSAWDEGFMARTILIYSDEFIEPDLFGSETSAFDTALAAQLVEDLRVIGKLQGQFTFSDDCKAAMVKWQKNGHQPAPTHIRLEHYCTRRMRHAIKLSMIAAADRGNDLTVQVTDFQQALAWMVEAETAMPNIFLEMVGKSDAQTMAELYQYIKGLWDFPATKNQPIRRGVLVNFLKNKVLAREIDKIIEIAQEAGIIVEMVTTKGDTRYRPGESPKLFNRGKA